MKLQHGLILTFKEVLLIVFITMLGIAVRGYTYGLGDQVLHLPLLSKLSEPNLYSRDYIFPLVLSHVTFVYYIIHFFSHLLSVEGLFFVYFILYVLGAFVFNCGIYLVSRYFFSSRVAGLINIMLLIWPLPVGGAAITTMETGFVLRHLSNALIPYTILCLFLRKWLGFWILVSMGILLHSLSLPLFLVLGITGLLRIKPVNKKSFFIGTSCFVLTIILIGLQSRNYIGANTLQLINTEWLKVLQTRTTYAFPFLWSGKSLVYLSILLFPLGLGLYLQNFFLEKRLRLIIYTILCLVLVIAGMQILFTSIFPLIYVVQLQLGRTLFVLILLSVICTGGWVVFAAKKFNVKVTLLPVGGMLFFTVLGFMNRESWIIQQKPEWVEIQKWITEHTTNECIILTNFYAQGFRVYSKRSIVGEYKDGTLALYSEKFAYEWDNRRKYLEQTDFTQLDSLKDLQRRYPFSLVLLPNEQIVPLSLIFSNQVFSVYKMPVLEPQCIVKI